MPNGSVLYVRDSTNNKNVILEVDGSNQLNVKDATAQASLSSINSAMATAANQATANTSLGSIDTKLSSQATATKQGDIETAINAVNSAMATAANQATANTSLGSIDTKLSSQSTAANQATANSSLGSIDTKLSSQATATKQGDIETAINAVNSTLSGTISVSSGAPSRANGNLASSASKTAGNVSSSVNGTNYKKAVVFGSCSNNAGSVRIQVSHDNTNFYEDHNSRFYANYSNGHFTGRFDLEAPYFKVEFMDTATYTCEYAIIA